MIKEGKFGPQEAVWLTTITISVKVFYTSPSIVSGLVGTAGWYMTIISAITATIGFTFIYLLLKQFPGKDIIYVFEITLGRYIGFLFSALLALLMLFIAVTRVREFTEVLKVYILPLTPPAFVLTLFIGVVAVFNILGLESMARFSKLIAYAMLAGYFTILALGQQNYSIHRIFPILGYGLDKTIINGIVRSSAYGEVIILAVFAGSLQGTKHLKKAGYASLVLSGMIISTAILAFILTFSYFTAMEITAPMYEMATLIDYGMFLQRVEPVFLFIWSIGSLVSVSAVSYAFISIYCKMFRIQDTRPIVYGYAIIIFALAMAQESIGDVVLGSVQELRNYGGIIFFIPPIISLIAAKLRKKADVKSA